MKEIKQLGILFLALALVPFLLFYMKAEGETKKVEIIEPLTIKQAIVAEVKHTENKGPKYTIRVGLGGSRKPIPTIRGVTTEERAKEWLETAGLGYTLPTWKKLGEKYKIDYALPICVGWSDSHLTKASKTRNNIGNTGNTDSGRTVSYETLDQGIEAVFRALNNKYLGKYNKLGYLSGEGRERMGLNGCVGEGDYCYASSRVVWHTNVRNCLSVIHNQEITDDYNFRK